MQEPITLYSYYRSSASYRVRIALHHKAIPFEYKPVHLLRNGGEQYSEEYQRMNPLAQVPCLVDNGRPLYQSMAIIQYLEEKFPNPSILPNEPYERALVMQISESFNSGIQPLQNLAVLHELSSRFGADQNAKTDWMRFWNLKGLASIEKTLEKTAGEFCFGDSVTVADMFLVPQVFSAKRFKIDLSQFKKILTVYEHAIQLNAFRLAAPENQPDFEANP